MSIYKDQLTCYRVVTGFFNILHNQNGQTMTSYAYGMKSLIKHLATQYTGKKNPFGSFYLHRCPAVLSIEAWGYYYSRWKYLSKQSDLDDFVFPQVLFIIGEPCFWMSSFNCVYVKINQVKNCFANQKTLFMFILVMLLIKWP